MAALGQAGMPFAPPFDRRKAPCFSELGAPRAEQLLQILQIGGRNGGHGDGRTLWRRAVPRDSACLRVLYREARGFTPND